ARDFNVGKIVSRGCARPVEPAVVAAYDAPFPDDRYKAGARQFPMLVPASPSDPEAPANRAAWQVLAGYAKPFLTIFGDSDKITGAAQPLLQALVPGAKGQPHRTLVQAGHFLQEDVGDELGHAVAAFV